jgi:nucleoside-diphosphate-sugar epimerase
MEIIGNGLLANAFKSSVFPFNENITVFASGVSNSHNFDESSYEREYSLLKTVNKNKKILYFSTCSIYDEYNKDSSYVKHKLLIEKYIKEEFFFYNIFRLPQVVGKGGNPNNLMNYLNRSIRLKNLITVQNNATRNIVDVDDIVRFASDCKEIDSGLLNIASPNSIGILSIIHMFESVLNTVANFKIIDGGHDYNIDINDIRRLIKNYDSFFPDCYLENVIIKYYDY